MACGDNQTPPATIEVTVSGLAGSGLVLQNNGADDLAIETDGTYSFSQQVAFGDEYEVTVASQPSSPTQYCTVTNGTGKVVDDKGVHVSVACTTSVFTVGGTVTGLTGSGLVLQNNGGDDLAIESDGTFTFSMPLASGTAFDVTVKTQPTDPWQTCTVTSGTGTIAAGNVTTVAVDCSADTFTVGGTVTGLAGTVVLQNNLGDNLPISADGTFTFASPVASGAAYSVTVLTQPTSPAQTCIVTNGDGTITNSDITDVAVTCTTNTYTIGGTVTGLAGTGLVLQNNAGDDLQITTNGAFTFTTPIASGDTFDITILTQPTNPWQTCTVSGGSGTVVSSNVTSVTVNCTTNAYTLGGTVSGLEGTGLQLALDGGAPLSIGADGTYAFPTPVASGTTYTVTVVGQPHDKWQTCTLSGATGTVVDADVTNIDVTCVTNTYTIAGTVTGLEGNGLELQNNGGDDLAINADGTFTFTTRVASGQPYSVAVSVQPTNPWQTCAVSNAAGTVGGDDITNVAVMCTTNTYAVGGTITGLAGTVVLQNNLGDNLTLTANGPFTFSTKVASGTDYAVTVLTQPGTPSQTCTVSAGTGTITNADVSSVSITCVTNQFAIGGTVTGLVGSGLVLRNNGGDDLPISADGTFEFATPIESGQTYAVTVAAQPSDPMQTCVVTGGTGTVGGMDVTSVTVNCTTNEYAIGGTVAGLGTATGLVLQNNSGDDLSVSADGTFAFATPVASGSTYSVSVKTQPTSPWETCTVANGSGAVTDADITDVQVTCTVDSFPVSVTVTGLAGSGLVLRNNGGDDLSIAADGTYSFATQIASGSTYAVTVATQPTSPWQTCTVAMPTGTMTNGVTLAVTCATNTYTIGGTVSGPVSAFVLQNNGGDDLSIANAGTFTFATPIASGQAYDVTVKTQPSGGTCIVSNGGGTVGDANVTSVAVECSLCGDGVLGVAEQCDDGNAIDSDACKNDCTYGPITVGGTRHEHLEIALNALGETFTVTEYPNVNPQPGAGVYILSYDGGFGLVDYTPMLDAGAHVLFIGGSIFGGYRGYISQYFTTDSTSTWHQSDDCTPDWITVGSHPITQFLPVVYEFPQQETSFHMLHFPVTQPSGASVLGVTCHGSSPGVLVTRRYASGGTLTALAFDIGVYGDPTTSAEYVQPFLEGYLAYLRSPH